MPDEADTQNGRFEPDPSDIDRIARSILDEDRTRHLGRAPLPDAGSVGGLIEEVRKLMFPGFFGERGLTEAGLTGHVRALAERLGGHLCEEVRASLRYAGDMREAACAERAETIAHAFMKAVPAIRAALALDAQAALDGDPAATHIDEVIFCYPGFDAIFAHRVAHTLLKLGTPVLPRIIAEQAHTRTGIDIHPGAVIGGSFFIDHGAGVVIGETTIIGDNARIYQGVTLGAKGFPVSADGKLVRGQKRHPTLGDRVTIYADAVILGGDTVVGDDCLISGGVFITESVPAGHVVRGKKPELVMRTNRSGAEPG